MIGGLLQATQDMQRDITEIRRDIKDSDARAALSYEQSEQRAAASRAKMYQETDELVERERATKRVSKLNADITSVKSHRRGYALEADGTWRIGRDRHGRSVASLVTAYWTDIRRVLCAGEGNLECLKLFGFKGEPRHVAQIIAPYAGPLSPQEHRPRNTRSCRQNARQDQRLGS